ncbi:MAG: phosphoglycolate phosphatase [Hyphomicrobiaceae bacterium]|nr:phosphoglycolate phosphatase [Hyphomicrobiaceae bacterium]
MPGHPDRADLAGLTVVFDLDGTLVDTAPDLTAATNFVLAHKGLAPLTIAQMFPLVGHGSRAMIEAGLKSHGAMVEEAELAHLHDMFLAYYADNVAVASRPFEHIPELIGVLRGRGARLAVCTNKVERLSRLLLEALDLAQHFAVIAGRDTYPVFKPAPGHLTMAIEAAGGTVENAIMVGDSETDIATARAAGVPSIAVSFGYTTIPVRDLDPDIVIDHYREFVAALDTLRARRAPA